MQPLPAEAAASMELEAIKTVRRCFVEMQTDNSVSGAAYVFVHNGATWSRQANLKAYNTDGAILHLQR